MAGAPGGAGRKRAGQKRSELLSVRLDDRTKMALEAEAARKQWTVSREAAWRLERSLVDQAAMEEGFGDSPTRGFAALVAMLSRGVGIHTNLAWSNDPYTFREFSTGLSVLLEGLRWLLNLYPQRPSGETVPLRVRQMYPSPADMPPPGELGARIARSLLDALPLHAGLPPEPGMAVHFAREYFEFPRIYRDLGLGSDRGARPIRQVAPTRSRARSISSGNAPASTSDGRLQQQRRSRKQSRP